MVDIMLIANIPKVPHLTFRQEHSHAERMHGCVAKALVVEPAGFVEPVEIRFVCFAAPEVERADLEV